MLGHLSGEDDHNMNITKVHGGCWKSPCSEPNVKEKKSQTSFLHVLQECSAALESTACNHRFSITLKAKNIKIQR